MPQPKVPPTSSVIDRGDLRRALHQEVGRAREHARAARRGGASAQPQNAAARGVDGAARVLAPARPPRSSPPRPCTGSCFSNVAAARRGRPRPPISSCCCSSPTVVIASPCPSPAATAFIAVHRGLASTGVPLRTIPAPAVAGRAPAGVRPRVDARCIDVQRFARFRVRVSLRESSVRRMGPARPARG